MNPRLQALTDRFAALKPRERGLIAGAVVVTILFGGYSLGVEPARLKSTGLERQIAQQGSEATAAEARLAALRTQVKDPDADTKSALAELRKQLAASDEQLHAYDGVLIAPAQVPQLLQSLLARHRGLTLVSLQSLPPVPLIAPPEKKEEKAAAAAPAPGGNIYKHGIEIKLAGNYLDLLSYVAELEQARQKLLWGRMDLAVGAYPRSELTLTVYTLSLDPRWLVL